MAQRKKPLIKTDEHQRRLVYSLVANCIGEYDRLSDMREPIHSEDLPHDMPDARVVLDVIYDCEAKSIAPEISNIVGVMIADRNYTEVDANDVVHNIMKYQTEDKGVDALSVLAVLDIKRRRVEQAKDEAVDSLENGEGSLAERVERAVNVLTQVNEQGDDDSVNSSQQELVSSYRMTLYKREENRKKGVANGPSLKFSGFIGERDKATGMWKQGKEGKIPVLRWGDTTLVTALPGYGKTTFGCSWAEHNAHELGINVLYIHNETDQETLMDRTVTRNTLVPTDYLKNFYNPLNTKDPAYEKVEAYLLKLQSTKADITYLYCPGWNVFKINTAIGLIRRLSDRQGKGLLVIVDYYNLIDSTNFQGEPHTKLGLVAINLRENMKKENIKSKKAGGVGVHMIVFAQETNSTTGETYPFGSKEILQYSQVHISINRKITDTDCRMGEKHLNTLGQLRYWCRAGELSHITTLKILKANDNARGDVTVWIENNMVSVYNPVIQERPGGL